MSHPTSDATEVTELSERELSEARGAATSRAQLSDAILEMGSEAERIRAMRQQAQQQLQAMQQRQNQTLQILASIMKTMAEVRGVASNNMK